MPKTPENTSEALSPTVLVVVPETVQVLMPKAPEKVSTALEPRVRIGRRPTFSDEQLLAFLRQIVAANGGKVPPTARVKELLQKLKGPSLATMTNRLGPITTWKSRLEKNAG